MSKCFNCNTKIGFLKTKHKLLDANDNEIYYCSQCYKEWEFENKKKLEKEKLEHEKQNKQIIDEYCCKFLQEKDKSYKSIAIGLSNNNEFLDLIKQNEIDYLINHFSKLLKNDNSENNSILGSSDYIKALQLLEDLKRSKKILQSKKISSSYFQIFQAIVVLANKDLNNIYDDVISRLYNSISQITKTDKKKIIEEYININLDNTIDDVNLIILKKLFDKFDIEYSDSEIYLLLRECLQKRD